MKIGVFDSGIGGKSVADALALGLPGYEIIFMNDPDNLPYGNKSPEELKLLVRPKLTALVDAGCEIIVVACNTVSCTILPELKSEFDIEIVGIVPMVKPASQLTKSGVIAVCATPTTLASRRYAELKDEFAKDIKVIEPDCSDWALMIENDQVDRKKVHDTIEAVCDKGADVIVLGCTHYHWIEQIVIDIADQRATVIQPETAIVERVRSLIEKHTF